MHTPSAFTVFTLSLLAAGCGRGFDFPFPDPMGETVGGSSSGEPSATETGSESSGAGSSTGKPETSTGEQGSSSEGTSEGSESTGSGGESTTAGEPADTDGSTGPSDPDTTTGPTHGCIDPLTAQCVCAVASLPDGCYCGDIKIADTPCETDTDTG